MLYGSVLEWVCQERKGWRKFENFKILRKGLKPRTKYAPERGYLDPLARTARGTQCDARHSP